MKLHLLIPGLCLLLGAGKAQGASADYPIAPVPFTAVHLNDEFWLPRIKTTHEVTIPIALKQCYDTGRVDNFLKAAGKMKGEYVGETSFDDTDIYKIIEGASYTLQTTPDATLAAKVDELIGIIAAAQEPDGYLYTARTINPAHPHAWSGPDRWSKESELSHELYDSGHLFEAAAAHFTATGKRTLLEIALKNADLLCKTFGPGRRKVAPGHQIVEMGLVRLYRITGRTQYLDLAKFFLDARGGGGDYSQNAQPVIAQTEAKGHAVRATYMYSGMADVAALTGDQAYLSAIQTIWKDVVFKKLYITGGIGADPSHEGFAGPYVLPNMGAYNETCAAIGNVYWNHRLFLLRGDSAPMDVLEASLYNGVLSGVSIEGDRFFYPNPLESRGQHQRSAWFGCACCPSNLCRFMPSVPGYMYAVQGDRVYVNLYASGKAEIPLTAAKLFLEQSTRYPWEGDISLTVKSDGTEPVELALRIPAWARGDPLPGGLYHYGDAAISEVSAKLNGKPLPLTIDRGYALIRRKWTAGDRVDLHLPMHFRRVIAREEVEADRGRVAFQRGPIVYAFEQPDNPDAPIPGVSIPDEAKLKLIKGAGLFASLPLLATTGSVTTALDTGLNTKDKLPLVAIPYFLWSNRGPANMAVWMPRKAADTRVPPRTIASTSRVSSSRPSPALIALNDQLEPSNSNDHGIPCYNWFPSKGDTQWVQYDFAGDKPLQISSSTVWWFDDGPWGGCRIPKAWRVLFLNAEGKWEPVRVAGEYPIAKDVANRICFDPVVTRAVRLEVDFQPNQSGGVFEWSISP